MKKINLIVEIKIVKIYRLLKMRIIQKRIKKIEDANTDDTSLCLIAKKETKENNGIENENSGEKKNEVSNKNIAEGKEITEENDEVKKMRL